MGLGIPVNCNMVFTCMFSVCWLQVYIKVIACALMLVVSVCGVGVLLRAFSRDFLRVDSAPVLNLRYVLRYL
jgi:hypothetical protein